MKAAQVAAPHLSLAEAILGSITTPMLAVDASNRFLTVNPAAEEFFQVSMQVLADQTMDDFFDPTVIGLLERARQNGSSVNDQGVEIRSPKLGRKLINIQISPLMDHPVALVIAIQERSLAEKLRGQKCSVARRDQWDISRHCFPMKSKTRSPVSGGGGADCC